MNLVIDVGNTLVKMAVFEEGQIVYKKNCIKQDLLKELSEVTFAFKDIGNCIVSAVGKLSQAQLKKLDEYFTVIELSHNSVVPFTNAYGTPETLGVDRIALVSAAAKGYPKKNVLIIDAGSCITYDFLDETNTYLGGGISPGITMRYNALNTFTSGLPLLDTHAPKELIGNSTATSIHSGVVYGVLHEIDGFIDAYLEQFRDLTVILTGGDAHFLLDRLKNDIFANSNFLLVGLNQILELNKS